MFTVFITEKGGAQRRLEFDKSEITIGRVQGNDIILPKGNVSKRHSRIVLKDGRFIVVDLKSTNGTYVNGRKITSPLVVKSSDKVYIGDFIITVEDPNGAGMAEENDVAEAPASEPPPAPPPVAAERRPPPLRPQPVMSPPPQPAVAPPPIARPTMRGFDGPPTAPPPLPPRGEPQLAPQPRPMPPSQAPRAMPPSQPPPRMAPAPQPQPQPVDRFALDEDPSDESIPPQPRVSERGGAAALRAPDPSAADTPVPPPPQRDHAPSPQYSAPAPYTGAASTPPPARRDHTPSPQYGAPAPYNTPAPAPYAAPAPAPAPYVAPAPAPAPYVAPAPAPAPYVASAPAPAPYVAPAAPAYVAPVYTPPPASLAYSPPPQIGGRPLGARGVSQNVLRALVARVAQSFDVQVVDPRALADEQRWRDAQRAIDAGIAKLGLDGALEGADQESLGSAALREAVGLGVLDGLLGDANVREIVVEGPGRVLVDSGDGLAPTPLSFSSHEALRTTARRILAQSGGDLDPTRPVCEARIGDHWSAHIVGAPVATAGAILVLTRIDRRGSSAGALVDRGTLTSAQLEWLRGAIAARRNVLVSGDGGVTEVLGALAGLIDARERIAIVEDVAGLAVDHPNTVSFASAGAGSALSLRGVLRAAERLRTDRLVIDDVRGAEAYDVLVTMAARRGGVLAGVHASSSDDALRHLEMLASLDGRVPTTGARTLVRAAVHIIVQLAVGPDGVRRVAAIEEVK